jgi:predicted transcriptional regulator
VIGRPIWASKDPLNTAQEILKELHKVKSWSIESIHFLL